MSYWEATVGSHNHHYGQERSKAEQGKNSAPFLERGKENVCETNTLEGGIGLRCGVEKFECKHMILIA
jgi:hypothetical protein